MRSSGFILIFLSFSFFLEAREPSYRALNTSHGLAQNQVVTFLQDSEGFVWLGTKAGLSRFDGIEFENFYVKDGLPDNFILSLNECPEGKIYVLTRKGFSIFDGEVFTPYPVDDQSLFLYSGLSNRTITTILPDGLLFTTAADYPVLFKDGYYYHAERFFPELKEVNRIISHYFSEDKQSFLFFEPYKVWLYKENKKELVIESRTRLAIVGNASGGIAFLAEDSLYFVNNTDLSFDLIKSFPYRNYGRIIYIDAEGNYYLVERPNNLLIIDPKGHFTSYKFDYPFIINVKEDLEGNLWVLGELGALKVQSKAFINYSKPFGFPDNIWAITEEPGKGLWLSTYGNGLFFFDGENVKRKNVSGVYENMRSADFFYMGSIRDSNNQIWLPHANGLVKIKDGNPFFVEYLPDIYTLFAFEHPESGDLFFAQLNQLTVLKTNGEIITHSLNPGNKPGYILSITADKLGRLWISNAYGISVFDGNDFFTLSELGIDFDQGAITMQTDAKGNIWLGGISGLYFYNYQEYVKKIDIDCLNHYVVDLKAKDSTGLFIGMVGGMAWMDLEAFYDKEKYLIDYFDHKNGFLGLEVLQNGSYLADDGTLWIAASDRIIHFDPSRRTSNQNVPNVLISRISLLDDYDWEWDKHQFSSSKSEPFVFSYKHRHLRFDFRGITMTNPKNVLYRYKIKGLDDGWSSPSPERYVSYTYLPAGEYVFKVDACNSEGVWSGNPATFHFIIKQAWWKTYIAIIIYIILGTGLILFFVYLTYSRVKQEKIKQLYIQKQITELKLEALKAQVDPHFIFNVLSSVGSSIYKGEKNEAYKNLTRFSKLIRQAFETNEKPYNSLRSEIEFVITYLELQQQRFKDSFDYEINISEDVSENTPLPRLLIQTLVENAIKHGVAPSKNHKKIIVSVSKENSHLKLIVEDNGVGRNYASGKNTQSTGKGLSIARELFDIFNAYNKEKIQFEIIDLFHEDKSAAGTRVKVTIPVNFEFEVFGNKADHIQQY